MMVGDFESLDNDDETRGWGNSPYPINLDLFFLVVVWFSLIILLNLIISLISDTYSKVHAKSEALMLKVMMPRDVTRWHAMARDVTWTRP